MARILITGSADGLGELAAKALVREGHSVVLHGRNETRGREAWNKVPGAETAVFGDLGSIEETLQLAERINALGQFDAWFTMQVFSMRLLKISLPSIHWRHIS